MTYLNQAFMVIFLIDYADAIIKISVGSAAQNMLFYSILSVLFFINISLNPIWKMKNKSNLYSQK
jgi:hypothetical protein